MLEIKYLPTAEITVYENNSRTHSDHQINQVAASIEEFGFTNPILIDGNQQIIAGHGRLRAAEKLNLDEVPTITLEGLTEDQRRAYVIADNKLALNAGWNEELLINEIEYLKSIDFNVDVLGWDVLPELEDEIDYSILEDDDELDDAMERDQNSVMKAIQIEFEPSDYEEAFELCKQIRGMEAYLGGFVLTALRDAVR